MNHNTLLSPIFFGDGYNPDLVQRKTIKEFKMTKKVLKGIVKSAKNNKTVVVEVTRKFKHPFYEKVIKRSKKYHAHDEKNKFKEGEKVSIIECKPYSKKKTWQVME